MTFTVPTLNGMKTYLTVVAGVATQAAGYAGFLPANEANVATVVLGFLAAAFLRFAHASSTADVLAALEATAVDEAHVVDELHPAATK